MNRIPGIVSAITTSDGFSKVELDVMGTTISAILIANPKTNPSLKIGNTIIAVFKESEVSLAKGKSTLSIQNKLTSSIEHIEEGLLMSRLRLAFKEYPIEVIIPTSALHLLALKIGDKVDALIRMNEIMLMNQDQNEQ